MSFDPEAFGAAVGMDVKSRIELALAPLAVRLGAIERAIADHQKSPDAEELTERFKGLIEREVASAIALIPVPKDGAPGRDGVDGKDGRDGKNGADGVPGANGKDGAPGDKGEPGDKGQSGEPGLPGRDGIDGKDGANGRDGVDGRDGKDGEPGKEGPAGKLPMVKEWTDAVHYESEVVTHLGSCYQALKDTAKEPPHADWRCIAAGGRDGLDGRSFTIRGTFNAEETYQALDVVALNGASFAARRDNPGHCPGDGWQLIASQGKQGKPGERGPIGIGERGKPGAVVAATVDDEGLLILTNGDGSVVTVDLYPLLSKLG